jgi:hypothetical protein
MLAQKHPAADEDNRVLAFNRFASPPVFQAFEPFELRPVTETGVDRCLARSV